ncbi:MAG: Lrp/AsnC family transcriptional regulator [Thermoplasmatota archaeon]
MAEGGDALDDLDRTLLRLLQEDARRSHRELARLADSTGPTVAARLRRLEEAGIIVGYTVRLATDAFEDVDLDAASGATVPCHTCGERTAAPRWKRIGDREHPFCCPTCEGAFEARHARFSA